MTHHHATFALAMPIADLINSNGREHYQVKAKKRAMLRHFTCAAVEGLPAIQAPARGVVTFIWPDKRDRDPDNYELKGAWDGLVDAGILSDDNGRILTTTVRFAAPWRHSLGRGVVVLGFKVESYTEES